METLDLFKDWIPEMIEMLKDQRGKGGMTGKTCSEDHRRKTSEALIGIIRGPNSEEHNKKISEALIGRINGPPSEETRRKISEAQIGKTRRPATEEEKRINSEAKRTYWANLTPEEKVEWMGRSLLSDESIKRSMEARKVRPNQIERIVDRYLQRKFPGEWAYNGDFSQGISIGRRIPDFVNVNGRKEVISVMGGLGFCHFLEDEKVEIVHYAKYGFKCTVIWEWDCYDPVELGKILVFKENR